MLHSFDPMFLLFLLVPSFLEQLEEVQCIPPIIAHKHVNVSCPMWMLTLYYFYPARACAKGLRNRFCPSVSQSVSQSVCPVKNFEISTFTAAMTWQSKKVYLIETKAVHSSVFPALF